MEYYNEKRKIPVAGEYDVIIAGGGPAGVGAALAAARNGKKTLLVERFGFLGGMWTAGLVNPLFDYEEKGGIVQEIVDNINAMNKNAMSGPRYYTFDIESMKLLLDRMMLAGGVDLLFHTWFCDVIMNDNTITGVIVENKSGRQAYMAKIVIDCTGDGDVAARAGAPFKVGRDSDGAMQPMTLMFKMNNMDYVQNYQFPIGNKNELYFLMQQAVENYGLSDYKFNYSRPCMLKLPGTHTGVCQMTHVRGRSGIDANDLTQAEIEGRELVNDAVTFFKKYLPPFKDAQLEQTGAHIGVRETRRITGEYELTLEDMLEGARFEDGFCMCRFNVDIHQPDSNGQEGEQYDMKPYHIPYRSLVPLKIDNLLVAGRCISGSYEAHASYRVTGDCVAMGQAAGTAAAIAIETNKVPRKLDGRLVIERMRGAGAKQ